METTKKKEATRTPIDYSIMQIVREKNPETVEELIQLVRLEHSIPEEKVVEHILRLSDERKLIFKKRSTLLPSTAKGYFFSTAAAWYWVVIALSLATTTTVFAIPEEAFPIVYVRYILGSIFVLVLPGYCFIKALFPKKELDNVELVALSLGMSLALVPVVGLLLCFTPWGIRATPIVLSLLALSAALATAAIIREYQGLLRESVQPARNQQGSVNH